MFGSGQTQTPWTGQGAQMPDPNNPSGVGAQMPNPANPSGQGATAPSNAFAGVGTGQQKPMDWQKLGQMGVNMMNQGTSQQNQQAQQMPHMNMVGQGGGQLQQNLQALMQPTQLMNKNIQNQMNPQNVVQSLLNPETSMTASQMQGLLH